MFTDVKMVGLEMNENLNAWNVDKLNIIKQKENRVMPYSYDHFLEIQSIVFYSTV